MTRPQSIVMFGHIYLGSLVIGLIARIFSTPTDLQRISAQNPEMAAAALPIAIAGVAFGFGIHFLLWFLTAYKRATPAKWILVVLVVLQALISGVSMAFFFAKIPFSIGMGLNLVAIVLAIASLFWLFKADAIGWFKGQSEATDPFDTPEAL